jgi:hypothetical protein
MMTLSEKIKSIYSSLTDADFEPTKGTILLQNDSDGKGDYIKNWSHPDFPQPTQAELDAI